MQGTSLVIQWLRLCAHTATAGEHGFNPWSQAREPRFLIWPGEKREETKSHRLWFQPRDSNLKGGRIRSLANLGKPPREEGGNRDSHWGQ